ncbi:hypothetical protein ABQZ99_013780 [Xanthomonas hortorum pv. vitians]|uniref:hypothetical protein n=1 Tax=Xanthomonas hortorum TaxID=56454 RepID=UPI0015D652AA|nr:hypothetical protein [Xanthomonas hortorum]MCE4343793.1 hypothetical protein [Xanthomonas hortorum pv. vitians]NMI19788.1 hypothetical protein [Xanthomonas hortorum pv. vitians]
MTRYILHPKKKTERSVHQIHETRIDPASKQAFQALAAAQGLSMRAALTQLVEQHAVIREPFTARQPRGERAHYTAMLPEVEVSPDVALALLIDANQAGIRMTEGIRQLVWRVCPG